MRPLKRRPDPNSLVITDVRGRRKEELHIAGESCARVPTSLARAFSLATRAAVAESSGRVKALSTASGCATGGGSLGSMSRVRTVSVLPDARCRMMLATRLPVASTGTAPIACHLPAVDARKCSGSRAIAPRIETIESARSVGALSVSRTMAPGSGRVGATDSRAVWPPSEAETRVESTTAVLMQSFTNCSCMGMRRSS
jgi:hypothetical protein